MFRIEVLDPAGRPLDGYSGDSALIFRKVESIRFSPPWQGGKHLSELRGRNVRLKFHLRNAKLYSFQVGGD